MNFKYSIFIFLLIGSACKQAIPDIADSRYNFLKQTSSLYQGTWLETKFKDEIQNSGQIAKALKNCPNPLALKIDYRTLKNDSLDVVILTTKGRAMHFPFILRKSEKSYFFDFPNLGYRTKNFILFKTSIRDTILLIKQYDLKNQLIRQISYEKISTKLTDKISQSIEKFLNTNLFSGTYIYGSKAQNLHFQCQINQNSRLSGLDGFYRFFFILSPKGKNKIRFRIGDKSVLYSFEKQNLLIHLEKISADIEGRQNYYFKYLYSLLARSNYFVDDIVRLNIKDSKQYVKINLKISVPFTFSQSVDSLYRKIINSGFFNYKIFYKGKLLQTDKIFSRHNLGKLYTQSAYLYFTELGQKRPSESYSLEINIPKYCLMYLPYGVQTLDLYIYQRPYSQAFDEQKRSNLQHVYIDKREKWIWAKVRFKIFQPKIFSHSLVLSKIKISNRSNVDATIVRNGSLADIFWAVFYPENDQIYWVSGVQKRTNSYTRKDTLTLYTYSSDSEFLIKIFDKDFGSESDLIGQRIFRLSELKNEFTDFSFDKVDDLSVKKE